MARVQSPRGQTLPSPVKSRERGSEPVLHKRERGTEQVLHKRLSDSSEGQRHRESRERSQPRGHQERHEVPRPVRSGPPVIQLQMIDRTVEEFGEDWEECEYYDRSSVQYTQYRLQYTSSARDHTSQYTGQVSSLYTVPASLSQIAVPPPAHEDQDFMPPPPPLPLPEFAQGCHKGSNTEFSDPNEEKTFTALLSKDISNGLLRFWQ